MGAVGRPSKLPLRLRHRREWGRPRPRGCRLRRWQRRNIAVVDYCGLAMAEGRRACSNHVVHKSLGRSGGCGLILGIMGKNPAAECAEMGGRQRKAYYSLPPLHGEWKVFIHITKKAVLRRWLRVTIFFIRISFAAMNARSYRGTFLLLSSSSTADYDLVLAREQRRRCLLLPRCCCWYGIRCVTRCFRSLCP